MKDTIIADTRHTIISKKTFNKTLVTSALLFIVHPLTAVIFAIKDYKSFYSKNVIWFFVIFYGFTIVISNEGMDANRYRDWFIELSKTKITFDNFVGLLYQEGSKYVDVVQPMITFLVSRFSGDSRVLFAVFGLVFGYFYSRNIWYLLDRAGSPIKQSSIIHIVVFAIVIGFWQINGFRMWTAAHLFFFGAIRYLTENKIEGIFIAVSSILVHFSYILPVAIFLAFVFSPKRVSLYFWFFIVSLLVSELDVRFVSSAMQRILPGVLFSRVEGFMNPDYIETMSEAMALRNWRYHLYSNSIYWVASISLIAIYVFGQKFIKSYRNFTKVYCFVLLFLACINLVSNIPSVSRFYSVAYLFAFAFLFLYFQHAPDFRFKKVILYASFPLLVFYCLGMLNVSLMTIGLTTVLGNPILVLLPWGDLNIPLSDLL